jgi:hypothetical protein
MNPWPAEKLAQKSEYIQQCLSLVAQSSHIEAPLSLNFAHSLSDVVLNCDFIVRCLAPRASRLERHLHRLLRLASAMEAILLDHLGDIS